MKTKLATPVLIACALFFGWIVGVGLYQHMFDIPKMLSSPLAMTNSFNNDLGQGSTFWIPLHGLVFVTLIASLILNWKDPGRKKLVVWFFIGFLYISVVSIFFAKELFAFKTLPDSPEFYERTHQWLALSWHRPILMVLFEIVLLVAISKSRREPS